MDRMYLLGLILAVGLVPLQAQGHEGDEQVLQRMQNEMNQVNEQINKMQREMGENPSEEIKAQLEFLRQRSRELEMQIQKLQREHGESSRGRPEEKGRETWQKKIERLHEDIGHKRQKLEEIDREIMVADEEQWEKLENKRAKILQELEKLQNALHKEEQQRRDFPGPRMEKPGEFRENLPGEAELMAALEKEDPELHQRLMELKKRNPMKFRHELGQLLREKTELEELRQHDPDFYQLMSETRKLERQVERLVEKIHRTGGGSQESLRSEIKDILGQLFDAREKIKQRELNDLRKKVEDMERQLQQRRANKEIMVDQRMRELLGEESMWD